LTVSWVITETDASCWRRPLCLTIEPRLPNAVVFPEEHALAAKDAWETIVDLSREDARVLRDFLDLLLRSPDLREDEEEPVGTRFGLTKGGAVSGNVSPNGAVDNSLNTPADTGWPRKSGTSKVG
jgi:hypothetical protein